MTYLVNRSMGDDSADALRGVREFVADVLATVGINIAVDDTPDDHIQQTANGVSTSSADFTSVSGVCKPQNFPALKAVQEFQRQLNRVAQVKGFGKIAVDGAVGPGTMALFAQVQNASGGAVMGSAGSCMGVAPDVDVIADQLKQFANSINAPSTASAPAPLTKPTVITKSGKEVVAPQSLLAGTSPIEKVAIVGVAGAIGYMLYTGAKRKRRK